MQVRAITEIVCQRLDGRAWTLRKRCVLFRKRPGGEDCAALFYPYAVPQIVAQHHVEPGHEHLDQKLAESSQARVGAGSDLHPVIDVSVNDELAGGVTLIQRD